jgi:hypothetical protein
VGKGFEWESPLQISTRSPHPPPPLPRRGHVSSLSCSVMLSQQQGSILSHSDAGIDMVLVDSMEIASRGVAASPPPPSLKVSRSLVVNASSRILKREIARSTQIRIYHHYCSSPFRIFHNPSSDTILCSQRSTTTGRHGSPFRS